MKGGSMPPLRKFQKEDILHVAYEIVKDGGFQALNARRIAQELHCSVQPIFHNFSTMEELEQTVMEEIYNRYKKYMMDGKESERPYKEMGISYIQFAKDYPEFFKILFMQKTALSADAFIMADTLGDEIIKTGQAVTGLTYEEQKKFHVKVWIFTHGIACLVATKTVHFTKEEIARLLENTVHEMLVGFKNNGKE